MSELEKLETKYLDYMEMSSDWFWEQDSEFRFTEVHAFRNSVLKDRMDSLIGKTRWHDLGVNFEEDENWRVHIEDLKARRYFYNFQYSVSDDEGNERFLRTSGKPIFDASGKFSGYRGSSSDVTEHKNAEDTVKQSKKRFKDYVESSSDWVWETDAEHRFTYVSEKFTQITGYNTKSVYGKTRAELGAASGNTTWQEHQGVLDSRLPFRDFCYEYIDTDNQPKWLSISGRPIFDDANEFVGYLGTGRDITEQYLMEARLKLSEARIRAIMDNSPSYIYLKDIQGKYVLVNKHVEEGLGLPANEIIGKTNHELYPKYLADLYSLQDREVIEGRKVVVKELEVPVVDGNTISSLITKFPIFDSVDRVSTVGAVIVDVTMLKDLERQLRENEKRLNEQVVTLREREQKLESQTEELLVVRNELSELNDQKDRFFSIISHDLKSPFNSLLGMTQMMSQMASNMSQEKLVEYAKDVNDAGDKVFELLENLLEWSRLQIEGAKFEPQLISLHSLTGSSVDILNPLAAEKDILLSNMIKDDMAYADPDMAQTVIRNLISNSLKFSPLGGKVEISSINKDGMVHVTVSDSGVGISKDQVDKVFALDQKTSTIGTAGEKGTGLGLPLCKEMIEKNGGKIWVESAQGEGSQFHFTLPIEPGDK
jgi:PAS domain S-box-containing protein